MLKENAVTLYLTGWQKRMVMDCVKSATRTPFNKITIGKIPKKEWVMYRQPVLEAVRKGAWNLYLTDEQINQVVEVMGIKANITALNISPDMLESKVIIFS
ncbi:MAG: hypothetical protein KAR40_04560 [Candidatus Sabulitectum sp.]|nr:hypothetical protein [Candidatus Sabulitectum sp.]